MTPLEKRFHQLCAEKTDIQAHLPRLAEMADGMRVVEFGFRTGVSTVALLQKAKVVTSYDIVDCEPHRSRVAKLSQNFRFVMVSSLKTIIPVCDVLFIDSLHTYKQLRAELFKHQHRVLLYIAIHDTETFKTNDKGGDGPGLQRAIDEFMQEHGHWVVWKHHKDSNGLTVLRAINP